MKEVAERAGVAMSSVSRVLSGHPDVSPEMHRLVMRVVRELGYRPDMLAQGLRRGKSFSVGFTVSDIANPVLALVVTGAEKRLRQSGYSLLLTNSEGDPGLDSEHIALLQQRRVDGLILSLADEHHHSAVEALRVLDVPVVLVDRDVPEGIAAGSATFDHMSGTRAATEYLLGLGHREFALITGGPIRPRRERRTGVEQALAASRSGARCIVYEGSFSTAYGREATFQLLNADPRPTAIIAAGNIVMQGSLSALREAGVQVGRDISFVACDDIAVAELHTPQIAVVRRDMAAAGRVAAELLLEAFEAGETEKPFTPREVVLPTEFVARPSCARVNGAG